MGMGGFYNKRDRGSFVPPPLEDTRLVSPPSIA